VFFENTACLHCATDLAFRWPERELVALDGHPRCANLQLAGCNWAADDPGALCACCRLTRTRPGDGDATGLEQFRVAEGAKRRLLFELGELRLATEGLSFNLLSSEHEPVTTGHAAGLVTLDLAESDAARREQRRLELGEPYRTVLGHFRHEVGHFYFAVLVGEGGVRKQARAIFGDEREDYGAALERHYAQGPPEDWRERHVSAYATMHPAEDWAETFAHVLHIWDTVQTAAAHGVRVEGPDVPAGRKALAADPDPDVRNFDDLLSAWLPLSLALNALNRSVGRDDAYPFVLPDPVVAKLRFAYERIMSR
jgi:hypothetical protein